MSENNVTENMTPAHAGDQDAAAENTAAVAAAPAEGGEIPEAAPVEAAGEKPRRMDCFRARKLSIKLVLGGLGVLLLGCLAGYYGGPFGLAAGLTILGILVMLVGSGIGKIFMACPHCGMPLYDTGNFRALLPPAIPEVCPLCGKKIQRPEK